MRPEDLGLLVELWVAAWRQTMPQIDFEARRDWIGAFLLDHATATLVAEWRGTPAGFATREGTRLHQLAVAPEATGHGVAVRLLDRLKAEAPTGLVLDVNQENPRAIRFYEREGFRRIDAGMNPASGRATWTMRWP